VPLDAGTLKQVPLFASLSDEDLNTLVPVFNELSFVAGHEITKEGRPGFGFFVIESGHAKVTKHGEERGTLGPGDYFGEIALIDPGPRLATVTAESELTAHVLSGREFRPIVSENPDFALGLLHGLWRILGRDED
jgi:CRP/FNR family transcriptional regulator, cyclic AMP receptor protein